MSDQLTAACSKWKIKGQSSMVLVLHTLAIRYSTKRNSEPNDGRTFFFRTQCTPVILEVKSIILAQPAPQLRSSRGLQDMRLGRIQASSKTNSGCNVTGARRGAPPSPMSHHIHRAGTRQKHRQARHCVECISVQRAPGALHTDHTRCHRCGKQGFSLKQHRSSLPASAKRAKFTC